MHKVFMLEDDFGRRMEAKNNWGEFAEFHFEMRVEKAIKNFTFDYDMLMLDHDLSDTNLKETGAYFCEWLSTTDFDRSIPIVIHSMNIVGAKNMKNILEDAGFKNIQVLYFYSLLEEWEKGNMTFLGNKKIIQN